MNVRYLPRWSPAFIDRLLETFHDIDEYKAGRKLTTRRDWTDRRSDESRLTEPGRDQ